MNIHVQGSGRTFEELDVQQSVQQSAGSQGGVSSGVITPRGRRDPSPAELGLLKSRSVEAQVESQPACLAKSLAHLSISTQRDFVWTNFLQANLAVLSYVCQRLADCLHEAVGSRPPEISTLTETTHGNVKHAAGCSEHDWRPSRGTWRAKQ